LSCAHMCLQGQLHYSRATVVVVITIPTSTSSSTSSSSRRPLVGKRIHRNPLKASRFCLVIVNHLMAESIGVRLHPPYYRLLHFLVIVLVISSSLWSSSFLITSSSTSLSSILQRPGRPCRCTHRDKQHIVLVFIKLVCSAAC
jgi:hypothetical protein